ncbi:tigger transposable element-derived protein 6-like [Aedes aegypti]|uniref:DDE-1 domain-containing protein n=1 Tax=Aedes aegypti TaxID=7159 RepID=A0A6I8U359_AEDAE|nr:tigger transposable element-derived protein 6-like [Aedes aegypti]
MSAAGHFIPPMLIFPRVRLTGQLKKGAPPETLFSCNTTGWMTIDDFSAWFDHFLAHTRPTAESPVLLLLDGHASHTKNLEFLDKAKRSHVTVVSMPSHCSHRLQPLDVSFMGPLKTNLSQVIEKYLKMNPGKVITLNEISALFGKAYLRSTSASVAVNGFNKTGIAPFNRAVFTDDDFAPADVSDIPLASNGGSSSNETTTEDKNRQQFQGVNDGLATIDLTKTLPNTVEGSQCDVHSDDEDGPFLGFDDVDITTKKITEIPTKRSTQLNKSFSVGPTAIRPFPKMALKERKSGRKKEKSKELTSSPYRNALRSLQAAKEIKQLKVSERASKKRPHGAPKPRRQQKENRIVQDVQCETCGICFSSSGNGRDWEKCSKCHIWFHKLCAESCMTCRK